MRGIFPHLYTSNFVLRIHTPRAPWTWMAIQWARHVYNMHVGAVCIKKTIIYIRPRRYLRTQDIQASSGTFPNLQFEFWNPPCSVYVAVSRVTPCSCSLVPTQILYYLYILCCAYPSGMCRSFTHSTQHTAHSTQHTYQKWICECGKTGPQNRRQEPRHSQHSTHTLAKTEAKNCNRKLNIYTTTTLHVSPAFWEARVSCFSFRFDRTRRGRLIDTSHSEHGEAAVRVRSVRNDDDISRRREAPVRRGGVLVVLADEGVTPTSSPTPAWKRCFWASLAFLCYPSQWGERLARGRHLGCWRWQSWSEGVGNNNKQTR